ncbi:hypothetical protein TTHN1_00826 [Thermus thermophilus]|uniref:Uncharacterized protein n=1 Tax=Thermus thermophilus TaxID=274 RepID=A0A3P4APL9_THETH|nr:hypothetical protein TTHN1_00826 [Thermus thermophilus]
MQFLWLLLALLGGSGVLPQCLAPHCPPPGLGL